jgi:hypothetical protein
LDDPGEAPVKRYALHGIAGLVERKRNRATGLPMGLYAAQQSDDFDTDDPWMVVCEDHGNMVSAPTMALAHESMAYPTWCETCSGNGEYG